MNKSILSTLLASMIGISFSATAATITAENIFVTGDTGGIFVTGDTLIAAWDNSSFGDNIPGIINVSMDLSEFGGGTNTAAFDDFLCGGVAADGIWNACWTIGTGVGPITDVLISVSASDNSGILFGPTNDDQFFAVNPIPVPAAAWLFGSALGLLGWLKRKAV